jgi:hypothetical protein
MGNFSSKTFTDVLWEKKKSGTAFYHDFRLHLMKYPEIGETH